MSTDYYDVPEDVQEWERARDKAMMEMLEVKPLSKRELYIRYKSYRYSRNPILRLIGGVQVFLFAPKKGETS